MIKLFFEGGFLMYPLAICFLITLVIVIERSIFWFSQFLNKKSSNLDQILVLLQANKLSEVKQECTRSKYLINKIILKCIDAPPHILRQVAEIEVTKEFIRLKKFHHVLDTIVAVSTMIGILGTVIGIIISFQAMASAGMDDPKAVTGGIGQALITTATGLVIAIFAMVFQYFFNSKILKVSSQIEIYVTELEVLQAKEYEPDSSQ